MGELSSHGGIQLDLSPPLGLSREPLHLGPADDVRDGRQVEAGYEHA